VTTVNGYKVEMQGDGESWQVTILDPEGVPVAERACRDEPEARTYASTVNQHIHWLSEQKFRRYYRLPDPDIGSA
jgi:hypothetical protein